MGDPEGYVYVIGNPGVGYYKIGKTVTPKTRLQMLKVLAPFPVSTRLVLPCYDDAPCGDMERAIHITLTKQGKHTNGEWFKLDEADLYWLEHRIGTMLLPAEAIPSPS